MIRDRDLCADRSYVHTRKEYQLKKMLTTKALLIRFIENYICSCININSVNYISHVMYFISYTCITSE